MDNVVISALNNLPGFPPAQTFKLGDWLVQIATRPAVPTAADLPLTNNGEGDARVVVDQAAWFIWREGSWYAAGGGGGEVALTPAVVPGTYGDSTNVPRVTIDSKGRVTAATAVPVISPPHSPARRVSTDTATVPTDFTLLVNASAGQVTITLTGTNGTFYNVKKIDESLNPVRLRPATGTIDGELFVDLPVRWDCISVHSEGGEWFIV